MRFDVLLALQCLFFDVLLALQCLFFASLALDQCSAGKLGGLHLTKLAVLVGGLLDSNPQKW
jgi:hypothetical protein